MKTLIEQLSSYATCHRDRRNIATHFIGVPVIVLAVAILLSRPLVLVAGFGLTPASALAFVAAVYYLALDLRYGMVMTALLTLCVAIAMQFAVQPMAVWLGSGIGLFVGGWIVQFLGHHYEGRKPAFVDDLMGLVIGPLFVVAELGFLLGLREEVRREIEARSGATRSAALGA